MSIRIVLSPTILFALGGGALAQAPAPTAADGPWSGQVQCVLSARGPTYQDDQTHTWRITGGPPRLSGMFRQWPAVWSVEGRGGGSIIGGPATWVTSVPETSAPITISEAGGRIRIASQHGLLVANGGMTVVYTARNQRSPASLEEWMFPNIEADASATTISETRSRPMPSYSRGWRQPSEVITQETCTWNFTRGGVPTTTDTGRRGQPPELSRSGSPGAAPAAPTTVLPPPPPLTAGGPATPPPGVASPADPGTARPAVVAPLSPAAGTTPSAGRAGAADTVGRPGVAPTTAGAGPALAAGGASPGPGGGGPGPGPNSGAGPGAGGGASSGRANSPVPTGSLAARLGGIPPPGPAPAPTSGIYLVTVTGLISARATENLIPVNLDGKGDEIYAAAVVRRYDRRSSQALESTSLQTAVYGDTNNAPGREIAGSMSLLGGIQSGDKIPKDMSATRVAAAQASIFPWRLFEGTLTDGVDALVISPSIWEWDNGTRVLAQWIQSQNSLTGSMLTRLRILDQINQARFGTLYLDPIQSASGSVNAIDFVGGIVAVGLLGIPVFSTGTGIFDGTFDRPFSLIPIGIGSMAVDNPAVVLTREIIEAALNGSVATTIPVPNTTVILIVPKPGVLLIGFTDGDIGANGTLLENRGAYYMVLQVERLSAAPAAPTQGSNSPAPTPQPTQTADARPSQATTTSPNPPATATTTLNPALLPPVLINPPTTGAPASGRGGSGISRGPGAGLPALDTTAEESITDAPGTNPFAAGTPGPAPQNVRVTTSSSFCQFDADVTWSAVPGATSYLVEALQTQTFETQGGAGSEENTWTEKAAWVSPGAPLTAHFTWVYSNGPPPDTGFVVLASRAQIRVTATFSGLLNGVSTAAPFSLPLRC